jgi:hypothetical protein
VAQRTDTGHNGRCPVRLSGKTLRHVLETVYDSIHHAATRFKVHDGTISSRVDKPHQITDVVCDLSPQILWTPPNLRPDSDVAWILGSS